VLTIIIFVIILVTIWPITAWAVRRAKRHRGQAMAVATLLTIFGINVQVTPPPPPTIEATQHREKEAADDE